VGGLWHKLPLWELGLILALSLVLLGLVLAATWGLGAALGLPGRPHRAAVLRVEKAWPAACRWRACCFARRRWAW
jgi:hypothetical protein